MILDNISNCEKYYSLSNKIERALRYLATTDFSQLSDGKYKIDGDDIFAIVARYNLKDAQKSNLEIHKEYIDVQFLYEGQEVIGYSNGFDNKEPIDNYNREQDIQFFRGNSDKLTLQNKNFVIFYPDEFHQPGIGEANKSVTKVVVKIRK